ncbi:uncharacterized protein LOC123257374 [Drosophila ananassae]|uniref:uncharacterized protein LOC123257374 n=1 Tax=Drosophila ananassae TaxID=7217 RepID=UPI001CFF7CD4|nr:uncharacterized protein LOC123257374 [Drosophila ananassae]
MEIVSQATFEFRHSDLFDIWLSNNRKISSVLDSIYVKISHYHVEDDKKLEINKKTSNFESFIKKRLPKCNYMVERFKSKHTEWMSSSISVTINENCNTQQKPGRRTLSYGNAGPRLKRKLASELANEKEHNTTLLMHAAAVSAKKDCNTNVASALKEMITTPAQYPTELRKQDQIQKPTPLTPNEALAYILENSLTKQQYVNTRILNINHHSDIYPSYNQVIEAKMQCRPKGIEVTETTAQVSLQNLLNHSAERIIQMQKDVFKQSLDSSVVKLICSYGFDGSTGQSAYKQKFEVKTHDVQVSDQSLFVTSVIPIKMIDSFQRNIWVNRTPQSILFCRPLKIEFIKETSEHIRMEKNQLDNQIELRSLNKEMGIVRIGTLEWNPQGRRKVGRPKANLAPIYHTP